MKDLSCLEEAIRILRQADRRGAVPTPAWYAPKEGGCCQAADARWMAVLLLEGFLDGKTLADLQYGAVRP